MRIFGTIVFKNLSYTQHTCVSLCSYRFIEEKCGCINESQYRNNHSNMSICFTDSNRNCSTTFGDLKVKDNFIKENCLPKCPLECTQQKMLPITTLFYKFPYVSANYYSNIYLNDEVNNAIEFSVFYESLSYTLIEEEPKMSAEDLIGSIGGHLHLFLGMSLLSFFELFELVVVIFFVSYLNKRKRITPKPLALNLKQNGSRIKRGRSTSM